MNKSKKIVIDAIYQDEPRVVVLDKKEEIETFEYQTKDNIQIKGNIYIATVKRIEPALQAAFINYDNNKIGFLPMNEIVKSYHNNIKKPPFSLINTKNLNSINIDENITIDEEYEEEVVDLKILENESKEEAKNLNDGEDNQSSLVKNINNEEVRIQDVIRRGQLMLVQAQKDPRGNKGASFTTNISIAGRYCIIHPFKENSHGISKKIVKLSERKKLKILIEKLLECSSNIGIIMRTSCRKKSLKDIKKDYEYITKLWNNICNKSINISTPELIHSEENIVQKVIRDMLDYSVQEIIVQGSAVYHQLLSYMTDIIPEEVGILKQYKDKTPLFTKANIEDKITNLYQPNVVLASGGYLVINPAEGLTLIDVNSGKNNAHDDIETTALKTNIEAATTVAREIKIRNISGLIIIDFIDMQNPSNRIFVKKVIDKSLQRDSAKTNTSQITQFGLMEMSRQRIKSSFLETHSQICQQCKGKGVIRNNNANEMMILRTVENEISTYNNPINALNLFGHVDVIHSLLNNRKKEIMRIESLYHIKLNLFVDYSALVETFAIEKSTVNNQLNQSNDRWYSVHSNNDMLSSQVDKIPHKKSNNTSTLLKK